MKEHICKFCGKQFETGPKLGGHIVSHTKDFKKASLAQTKARVIVKKNCISCGKEFEILRIEGKNGPKREQKCCSKFCAHVHVRTEESKKKTSITLKLLRPVKRNYCNCGKQISKTAKLCRSCNSSSLIYRQKLSKSLKGHSGGYREKGGRGKHGWYKGYWCDSSWELAYVIYAIEHGIQFERNNKGFEYEFNGQKFKYYPDFKMQDGSYIEIKGWLDEKNKAKISQFSEKLIVIGRAEIKPYLDYAIEKYGKEYINLYEQK